MRPDGAGKERPEVVVHLGDGADCGAGVAVCVPGGETDAGDGQGPALGNVGAAAGVVPGEALASHADWFVTGDAALLCLAAVGALKIVSPRRFWEVLRAGNG